MLAGDQWSRHRKMITPSFHFGVLEEFGHVMSEKMCTFNECLEAARLENPGKPLNIFDFAIRCALDTICETAMGTNVDMQRNINHPYSVAIHR